jgi:hypothetical protein
MSTYIARFVGGLEDGTQLAVNTGYVLPFIQFQLVSALPGELIKANETVTYTPPQYITYILAGRDADGVVVYEESHGNT